MLARRIQFALQIGSGVRVHGLKGIVRLATVAIAAVTIACQSLSDGAKSKFSQSYTCPSDRVEVRERPELHPSDWLKSRKPPTDVAGDPDRLRMWQSEQDQRATYEDQRYRIYEARGCGHQSLYECARARKSYNTIVIAADCSERPYRSGVAKW